MNLRPLVSIVILNWNGKSFLEKFLPSVLATDYPNFKVVVADNGSTDDSVSFLSTHYPKLRCIRLGSNMGFAKGYNEALRQISSDYYVLLNSDVETTNGWIQPMVDLLENDPSIGACQPKLLCHDNRNLFEYAGAAGGWIDKYGYPFCKGRIFDVWETDRGQYDRAEPIFWASGAALFIRAPLFHEINGFDEFFFAHQEEIDLCWRLQLAGHKIYSCPAAVVYHVGGGTLHKSNALKTFLNFRNNRIMLSKNLPLRRKLWVMPVRAFLDALSAWKGLITGDGKYFLAVVRAHVAFIRWWLFQKRKSVFPASRSGTLRGMLRRNIIWEYFIRKKKFFSEIVDQSP
ncbi:MAG TPA: glycosyltransferase family 2 protein [Chitinophagaceae bacterium]|nr:glycosyltransferase family 2 protein [Chitinophagaceae bacterium]